MGSPMSGAIRGNGALGIPQMVVNVAFGSHRSESAVAVTAQHVPIVTLVTVGRIVLSAASLP